MKFIVCVKQVPDTREVKIDEKTGTIIREGVPSILNNFDEFALNEAVRLKEKVGGSITAISMGPIQAEDALRKCLAIGADEAILLTDPAFAGADTWATSYTLAQAIKEIEYDIIFCGQETTDGCTGQVGPELAQHLALPHVSYVEEVESVEKKYIICKRVAEEGYERIRCDLPALIACLPSTDFEPRIPNVMEIAEAMEKPLLKLGTKDMKGDQFGLEGSPTQVIRTYPPLKEKGPCIKIEEIPEVAAEKIVEILRDKVL